VLADCHRLLDSRGLLLISVPNVANITVRLALLFGRFEYTERGILDRTHVRFYTSRTAREMIDRAGYEIVAEKVTVMPLELVLGLRPDGWPMKTIGRTLASHRLSLGRCSRLLFRLRETRNGESPHAAR